MRTEKESGYVKQQETKLYFVSRVVLFQFCCVFIVQNACKVLLSSQCLHKPWVCLMTIPWNIPYWDKFLQDSTREVRVRSTEPFCFSTPSLTSTITCQVLLGIHKVSLCISGSPETYSVVQAVLKLKNLSIYTFQIWGKKVHVITSIFCHFDQTLASRSLFTLYISKCQLVSWLSFSFLLFISFYCHYIMYPRIGSKSLHS